jgi:hypothetical protein
VYEKSTEENIRTYEDETVGSKEVQNLKSSPNMIRKIKSRKMRRAEHVV